MGQRLAGNLSNPGDHLRKFEQIVHPPLALFQSLVIWIGCVREVAESFEVGICGWRHSVEKCGWGSQLDKVNGHPKCADGGMWVLYLSIIYIFFPPKQVFGVLSCARCLR